MKRCPTCNRTEIDAALTFCRVDGARLIASAETSETPTAILTTVNQPGSHYDALAECSLHRCPAIR